MLSFASTAWFICTAWVSLGGLFRAYKQYVPKFVLNLYAYGKAVQSDKGSLLVNKSYFSHFYLSGCICITTLFLLSLHVTCGGGQWPPHLLLLIDLMRWPTVESFGDMFSNLIVLACANVQVVRRFLECLTVSVYSASSKMNFSIYIVGVMFYAALPITSLSGTDLTQTFSCADTLSQVRINHMIGVAIFIWASWQQNIIAVKFAKLRKDKSGKVENTAHHIPHGGLFEYVSCPHYFVEILIYLSFNIITSFSNTKLIWLFVFVLTNQLFTGYYTHSWYKETFKNYPKNRKSTIPFIL